eukprot:gnl/MRDRNA2_/MRDRNA2_132481_c0_seq1.p1 gnl/MRDRNA2_/MRDRNA2_132481_c0~~gnl/MRDRNA2_/MRDRNA2_132481_c0_seq1.p1  ORF type:complete len:335 (+),score=57.81 gnl/MRDRNA2_/MRDRNA2_132481_c0_seq1:102-1106(+)
MCCLGLGKAVPNDEDVPDMGRIQKLKMGVFQKRYSLGGVVMHSRHKFMEIRYATRKTDNKEVVVKLRYKPGSFINGAEEAEWRRSTHFMLNMPSCEGVALLHEVCEDTLALYIVTELAAGMDLSKVVFESKRSLTVDAVGAIMRLLLEAIAHMHEHGAIHRDLKLENVVLDAGQGQIDDDDWKPKSLKIIDFDTVVTWSPNIPRASCVVGTSQYIAPEAYDGIYSPSSDIFAAGVIFYKFSTGRFPYSDDIFAGGACQCRPGSKNMQEIQTKMLKAEIDWTNQCFAKDPALLELCMSMLSVSELQRPSAREALQSKFFGSTELSTVMHDAVVGA